jgi:Leucine-rich repeat (LRR) protein
MEIPEVRQLAAPLTAAMLRPLDPRCHTVQFEEALSPRELERVALFLSEYPSVTLRIYGAATYSNLDFLGALSRIRRIQIELFELTDVDGLRFLSPKLDSLGLGATRKRFSLRAIEQFFALSDLWIDGHQQDFDVIGQLHGLRRLSLRSVSVTDLSALQSLVALTELEIKLGGITDLRVVPTLPALRRFEAWQVRGLAEIAPVISAPSLRSLHLQSLKGVTSLPSFALAQNLQRLQLESMKRIIDLTPIAEAPALQDLLLIDMGQLQPDSLQPFVNHPTLRAAVLGLNSDRKNSVARLLLGLPDVRSPDPARTDLRERAT